MADIATRPAPVEAMPEYAPTTITGRLMRVVRRGGVQILLAVVGLFWLLPTVGLFITSLRPVQAVAESGWWTVFLKPTELTLQNYRRFLENPLLVESIWNTFAITIPATILVVLCAAMAGYALAWGQFWGRDALFLTIVGLMVVPLQMGFIPAFDVFRLINVSGIPAVVFFHVAYGLPFAVFLLRSYFAALPSSLMEAARIDGASELGIFFRIVLPLGLPAVAALSIFQFVWVWNDLLVALIFAAQRPPITVAIAQQLRQFGSNVDLISSAAFISVIVPLVVYFAFQKYFEAGLLGGSVK